MLMAAPLAALHLTVVVTEQRAAWEQPGLCLCCFPGSSHGGGKQKDLDEGHHFQGGQVGEDGLQRGRKAEETLEKGLRVIKHPLTHSLDTQEGMHNDDAGSLRSDSPPPLAFGKGGRINLESRS